MKSQISKGPRVTLTKRTRFHQGGMEDRWRVGNLDQAALKALYLAVANATSAAERYPKDTEDPAITDGRARLMSAVSKVVDFKEMNR